MSIRHALPQLHHAAYSEPRAVWTGRCLINCIRDAKIRLHNVAVAVLSKRIQGKGFAAEPREHLVHQTQRKRADIEVRSDSEVNWKRASWVQETCSLIQAAVLRTASRLFHRGLRECFEKDYEHLFDVPQHSRTDNDVSGLAPIYIPAAG